MKITLPLILVASLLSSICPAQNNVRTDSTGRGSIDYSFPEVEDYNSWDLTGHFGLTYPSTDITGRQRMGIGIDLTKFLSHSFALQARLLHAGLKGEDENRPQYQYTTNIQYDITLNAVIQAGNISFLQRRHAIAIFASAGFGILHYSPKVFLDGGYVPLKGVYSQYTSPPVIEDYEGSTDVVIPLAIGAKYRIADQYSLLFEYSLRKTYSDKLDGFFKLLSADDNYSYISIGLIRHLGSAPKVLEWENPLQQAYNDLYQSKNELAKMKKDSDNDGVPDLYDKDPNTPAGAKVYGDGTAVDTDDDGIPDYADAEPFSSKHAVVDARGKEIQNKADTNTYAQNNLYVSEILKNKIKNENEKKSEAAASINSIGKPNASEPQTATSVTPESGSVTVTNTATVDSLPSVYFKVQEDALNDRHYPSLNQIGKIILQNNSGLKYSIVGVCDSQGSLKYNMALGKRRAEAVREYLMREFHIDGSRLIVETLGKTGQNSGALNRRVDVVIVK